jgi:hypothetical protein
MLFHLLYWSLPQRGQSSPFTDWLAKLAPAAVREGSPVRRLSLRSSPSRLAKAPAAAQASGSGPLSWFLPNFLQRRQRCNTGGEAREEGRKQATRAAGMWPGSPQHAACIRQRMGLPICVLATAFNSHTRMPATAWWLTGCAGAAWRCCPAWAAASLTGPCR